MSEIRPQPGPQKEFLSTTADIAIYGGSAGAGKSFALLLEPLRHLDNKDFGAVIFRRNTKQVRNEGGLWDTGLGLYSNIMGLQPKASTLEFIFPSGMKLKFDHLEYESTVYSYQGAQIPFIGFDELTHFTANQFWYMLSRNRSAEAGVSGYIRATCNADADSWVRSLISWWIDSKTGYAIPERSGVLRYFVRVDDKLHWADTPEELIAKFGKDMTPKSLTFIPGYLKDNQILMKNDPSYLANLNALPLVERMRLKEGNWNAKSSAGMYFKKEWFEIVEAAPVGKSSVRYWDRAATEVSEQNPNPDWTVGLKLIRDHKGIFYVTDISRFRGSPFKVESAIINCAKQDGIKTQVHLEQDPGQAGVVEVKNYSRLLAGFDVRFTKVIQAKEIRARSASAQAEAGNIKLVRADWNEEFLNELASFPESKKDDQVDSLSGAINSLMGDIYGQFSDGMVPESETRTIAEDSPLDLDW